jgi:hypothetical protein
MKRVVTFNGEKAPKRFELCWIALLNGGDGSGRGNRETTRREARLLDALEGISAPQPEEHFKDKRVLQAQGGTITIDQDDHALLSKYLDVMPWAPRAARDAVDVQDWFGSAEKVD